MVQIKNAVAPASAKPSANGADFKTAEAKPALTPPVIAAEKRESLLNNLPPITARLKKLEEITELAERREVITEAIQNLTGFYIAPDGSGCNLRLQDSKGKTFSIVHPSVVGEMVSMAKEKLSAELLRIESLIDFTI